MMYPRLKLLQRLLAEDGVIFISIDDNELYNLKSICDEIFGLSCFVSNISWQRTYSTRNDSKGIVNEVEHLLVYSERPGWNPNKLPRTAEMDAKYKNPDNDVLPWTSSDAFAPGAATHQGMVYAIQHPFTGKLLYPYNGSCWRYQQDTMLKYMNGWAKYELRQLDDAKERAEICGVPENEVRPDVMALMLADSLDNAAANAQKILKRGQWPRFYFTQNGKGGIRRKTYIDSVEGKPPTNLWQYADVGHTDEAAKTLKGIFGGRATFDTPKPMRLVERVLQIAGEREALILDSFAGSGTTAHAVLNMNKADGGNRKFILVEMENYAGSITAERVKRVIDGYGEGKKPWKAPAAISATMSWGLCFCCRTATSTKKWERRKSGNTSTTWRPKTPCPPNSLRTSPTSWVCAAIPPITSTMSGKVSLRWIIPFSYYPDQSRGLHHLCRPVRHPAGNTAQVQHHIQENS